MGIRTTWTRWHIRVISRQVKSPAGSEITANRDNLDSFRFRLNRNESSNSVAEGRQMVSVRNQAPFIGAVPHPELVRGLSGFRCEDGHNG